MRKHFQKRQTTRIIATFYQNNGKVSKENSLVSGQNGIRNLMSSLFFGEKFVQMVIKWPIVMEEEREKKLDKKC
jgi:hypothetical protein